MAPASLPACSFLVTLMSNLAEPSSARMSTAEPADLLVPVDALASVKWPRYPFCPQNATASTMPSLS
eukprot:296489-Alexandrium_andersonii.AAC.1